LDYTSGALLIFQGRYWAMPIPNHTPNSNFITTPRNADRLTGFFETFFEGYCGLQNVRVGAGQCRVVSISRRPQAEFMCALAHRICSVIK
jgi:hypothetical protein